jgi:hypothetical protein
MLSFMTIIVENFTPDPVYALYINMPIITLDFKDLILGQCPEISGNHRLRSLRQQYIDEINLTLFDFGELISKLKVLLG